MINVPSEHCLHMYTMICLTMICLVFTYAVKCSIDLAQVSTLLNYDGKSWRMERVGVGFTGRTVDTYCNS